MTPALSSKYINVPSFLLKHFLCLMTTAGITFFRSSGFPFFTAATNMSPHPAAGSRFNRPLTPWTAITNKFLAPVNIQNAYHYITDQWKCQYTMCNFAVLSIVNQLWLINLSEINFHFFQLLHITISVLYSITSINFSKKKTAANERPQELYWISKTQDLDQISDHWYISPWFS